MKKLDVAEVYPGFMQNLQDRSARPISSVLDTELRESCSLSENYSVLFPLDVLFYKCVSKAMCIIC